MGSRLGHWDNMRLEPLIARPVKSTGRVRLVVAPNANSVRKGRPRLEHAIVATGCQVAHYFFPDGLVRSRVARASRTLALLVAEPAVIVRPFARIPTIVGVALKAFRVNPPSHHLGLLFCECLKASIRFADGSTPSANLPNRAAS